jgi:hypothetical protein
MKDFLFIDMICLWSFSESSNQILSLDSITTQSEMLIQTDIENTKRDRLTI